MAQKTLPTFQGREKMNALIPLCDVIAHQKAQLSEAERLYDAATKAGNYGAAQWAGRRITRLRTALVLHGAMESMHEVDREACRERDRDEKPWTPGHNEP